MCLSDEGGLGTLILSGWGGVDSLAGGGQADEERGGEGVTTPSGNQINNTDHV